MLNNIYTWLIILRLSNSKEHTVPREFWLSCIFFRRQIIYLPIGNGEVILSIYLFIRKSQMFFLKVKFSRVCAAITRLFSVLYDFDCLHLSQ